MKRRALGNFPCWYKCFISQWDGVYVVVHIHICCFTKTYKWVLRVSLCPCPQNKQLWQILLWVCQSWFHQLIGFRGTLSCWAWFWLPWFFPKMIRILCLLTLVLDVFYKVRDELNHSKQDSDQSKMGLGTECRDEYHKIGQYDSHLTGQKRRYLQ